jgi:hypothetical protein
VAAIESGNPVFPLPKGKGSRSIRRDLKAAAIPYRDAAGLVFDFHSLRCEMATLADGAASMLPKLKPEKHDHETLAATSIKDKHVSEIVSLWRQ